MSDDEGAGGGGGMKKKNRFGGTSMAALSVAPGEEKQDMLDLSESGRFIDGSLIISPVGLTVAASPGVTDQSTTYKVGETDFLELEVCGRGSSSVVRKALYKKTNQLMALKAICVYDSELRKQLLNEIKHLFGAVSCAQLVKFHGAYYNEGHITLALEYATAGSLQDVLESCKKIDEVLLAYIMHQILKGLLFMHKERHLIHRDLKPSNLLFDHTGRVLLTDFGVSRSLDETLEQCQTFVGTFHYFSPERFVGEVYSYASDIWSVGVIAVECATGVFPFKECKGYWELLNAATTEAPPNVPESEGSPDLRDFISQCLVRDPAKRATAEQLLKHPYITKNCGDKSKGERAGKISAFVSNYCSVFSIAKEESTANEIGFQFVQLYFSYIKNQRRLLASLYNDESVLVIDGDRSIGRRKIMDTLMMLDCELILNAVTDGDEIAGMARNGDTIISVSGKVASDGGKPFQCEFTIFRIAGSLSFCVRQQVMTL